MSDVTISFAAKLAIATRRWIRNTRPPAAEAQNMIADLANQAAFVRAKPVFSFSSPLAAIPSSVLAERERWRFAFHAQPFTQYLRVQMLAGRRNAGTPIKPYVRMVVRNGAGAIVGEARYVFGTSGLATPTDVPSEWGATTLTAVDLADETLLVTLPPDADYFVTFSDFQYARLISAQVYEVSLLPTTENGYVPNTLGSGSPIYTDQRSLVAQTARLLHRRYAAQLWNWTRDTTALTLTATERNVVDATSTTVSTTTPGVTLDMSRRVTLRTTTQGVPVVMWAHFASVTGSASVIIKNSAGTALVTATASAAGWVRAVGYLPAASGKYDLHGSRTTAGTLSAVSLYELDYTPDSLTLYIVGLSTTPEHDTGDDFTLSVVAVGQQSNVSVVLTCDAHNSETRTGIGVNNVGTIDADLMAANPGWTVVTTYPTNQRVFTFTRLNLPEGTTTITFPALVHVWRYYSLSDATGDVALTGGSVSVPSATGDSLVVVPNDAVVVGTGGAVLSGVAAAFTVTASYMNGSPSGTFTMPVSLSITTGTLTQPTTTTNTDTWTIGAWTGSTTTGWSSTMTRSGLPTGDGPSSIVFATTYTKTYTAESSYTVLIETDGSGGGYTATQHVTTLVVTSASSLAPIAALTTGGF